MIRAQALFAGVYSHSNCFHRKPMAPIRALSNKPPPNQCPHGHIANTARKLVDFPK
jgi:hypothetical protein